MQKLADLIKRADGPQSGSKTGESEPKKKRTRTERDELFDFFFPKLAAVWGGKRPLTRSYFGFKISLCSLQDLRYAQSVFKDTERRYGLNAAAKQFWGSLKPKMGDVDTGIAFENRGV